MCRESRTALLVSGLSSSSGAERSEATKVSVGALKRAASGVCGVASEEGHGIEKEAREAATENAVR